MLAYKKNLLDFTYLHQYSIYFKVYAQIQWQFLIKELKKTIRFFIPYGRLFCRKLVDLKPSFSAFCL